MNIKTIIQAVDWTGLLLTGLKAGWKAIKNPLISAITGAAIGVGASSALSGCTTVIVPKDNSKVPAVTVTGALPIGVQLNNNK